MALQASDVYGRNYSTQLSRRGIEPSPQAIPMPAAAVGFAAGKKSAHFTAGWKR